MMNPFKPVSPFVRRNFVDTMLVFMVAELSDSLCSVVDGIFIGRYLGTGAIAAHGIASPVFVFICIFSYFLTTAFQQMGTVAMGKGNVKEANSLFNYAMAVSFVISLSIFAAGLLAPRSIAALLGEGDGPVGEMTARYLKGVFIGAPALMFFLVLVPVLQLDGKWNLVRIGSVVMAVSDVAIDYLNVKVFHGGMFGMGLATSVSYFLGLLVLLTYFLKKDRMFRIRRIDMTDMGIRKFTAAGMPAALRWASMAVAIVIVDKLVISSGGTTSMAAMGVQRNLSEMLLSLSTGLASAVLMFTGISFGEKDRNGLMDTLRLGNRGSFGVISLVSLLLWFFTPSIVGLYLYPADVAFPETVRAVRWLVASMPLLCWNRNIAAYMQGIGKNRFAVLIYVSGELVLLCGFGAVLGLRWGAEGVFASYFFAQLFLLAAIQSALFFTRDRSAKGLEAFLSVPENFGVPAEMRLSRMITIQEQVWELSEESLPFCEERGVPHEKAYLVSMYIEEMGKIITTYGFTGSRPHKLEVRVSIDGDTVIIRFRDNCRRFDIREQASFLKNESGYPDIPIAIRMVMGSCKDIVYNNSLNANNLMVVI